MYTPKLVAISFDGVDIVDFASDTFVKAARTNDAFALKVGVTGTGVRSQLMDHSGTFEFTLLASSPSNDYLQAKAIADELSGSGTGTVVAKDANGTAGAQAAVGWVKKIPDLERAKELGEVTWVIETDDLELTQGSLNSNL